MEDKVAIVTGGAGGLGSEICRKFAARGAAVAVADVNGEAASEVANAIASNGGQAIAVQVEVTNEESVVAAVKTVVEDLGRVDYLVHCAGTNIKSPVLDMSLDQWNLSLEAHLTGAFLFCREAGKQMVEQGEGGRRRADVVGSSDGARARTRRIRPGKSGAHQLCRTARP